MNWTVARFPNGTWTCTTGGKPTDMDYVGCEVFVVDAANRQQATKKAQAKRSRQRRAAANSPLRASSGSSNDQAAPKLDAIAHARKVAAKHQRPLRVKRSPLE